MDVSRQITDISYMQNVSATVDYAGVEKILNDFFYESLGSENSCLFELAASLFARHQYDAVIYYLKDDICADDLQRTISLLHKEVSSVTGIQITACLDFKIGVIELPIPVTLQTSPSLR